MSSSLSLPTMSTVKKEITFKLSHSPFRAFQNCNDPQAIFNDNEILIGNYRLERQNSDSQWTVTEVGQANMRDSMQAYFRFRWRGRLGIHLKMDKPFLTVLRVDYFTDWVALMIFSTFFFGTPGMR